MVGLVYAWEPALVAISPQSTCYITLTISVATAPIIFTVGLV